MRKWPRRTIVKAGLAGVGVGAGWYAFNHFGADRASVFIGRAANYQADLAKVIESGFKELDVGREEIRGRKVLLKPNMVEPRVGMEHVNTNPAIIRAAAQVLLSLGAKNVIVAEGAGHRRDSLLVLEQSGMSEVLCEDRIPFVDLNSAPVIDVENVLGLSRLPYLTVPAILREVDFLVSVAKMKTHHWAGVTLSMKNLFGIMPGRIYGWPKNVLHWAGIIESILDINAAVKTHFAIVDGVIGMEGDGPIMGTPAPAGVIVMGRQAETVDATCCRVMGFDPDSVDYLARAGVNITESAIDQRGEEIGTVARPFSLIEGIPAHAKIRRTS